MNAKAVAHICAFFALSCTVTFGQSASKRKSPTSKFYVAEVTGFSEVNTGLKIEDLTEKSVFDAEGATIETKPDSENALVMSNGTGIFFGPNSKLVIKRFIQEPFSPNRADLESEPSVSQTKTMLSRGGVGVCTSKLVAGSSLVYDTWHGSISILSQNSQKLAIEVSEEQTTVTLFEGAVTLRGDNMAGGETLQPGQQAVIKARGVNLPPEITIGTIPDSDRERLENMVNGACQARKKVYFDVAEREQERDVNGTNATRVVNGASTTLIPVTVTPLNRSDVGPVVSPARSP